MAINKNHEFEEINGIRCSIVEKNATAERVQFLKELLELNGFSVMVTASPPAKPAVPKPPLATEQAAELPPAEPTPPAPETFTIGVTHLAFNPTNALFGRLLRTADGRIVTPAFWNGETSTSNDETPYFE